MHFRETDMLERDRVAAVCHGEDAPRQDWVVTDADRPQPDAVRRFSGADAMIRSLTFAHNEYSRVRWMSSHGPLRRTPQAGTTR